MMFVVFYDNDDDDDDDYYYCYYYYYDDDDDDDNDNDSGSGQRFSTVVQLKIKVPQQKSYKYNVVHDFKSNNTEVQIALVVVAITMIIRVAIAMI